MWPEVIAMEIKSILAAMGVGAAAGTAVGMMLPRNKAMRQMGRNISAAAADTMTKAADTIKMQ